MTVTESARTSPPDPESAAAVAASFSTAPRFRFRNLGPVRDAELELGDLTLLVGRNNTGKTYIAYTLYGFLKMWQSIVRAAAGEPALRPRPEFHLAKTAPELVQVFSRAAADGAARWSVSADELDEHRRAVMSVVASEFSGSWIHSIFNAPRSSFSDSSFECVPAALSRGAVEDLSFSTSSVGSWRFRFDGGEVLLECVRPSPTPGWMLEYELAPVWLAFLFPELRLDPFALCDERFGISLFYRELDFTKSQLVDLLQNLGNDRVGEEIAPYRIIDRGASRYAKPIKDNIDYTRSLPDRLSGRSVFAGDRLYNGIRDLMGANYRVEGDGSIHLRSQARGKNRFDIPLHLASSSTRGFSDFYFFLKHTATENHLLIVDEPETHLDPANQILLARLLSRLMGLGLRILVTTHSDYLLKELNNLIMLHGIGGRVTDNADLDYTPADALDPRRVRSYCAEKGGLTACAIDEYGMDIPMFDTTIDRINRVSHALNTRVRARRNRP